MSVSSSFHTKIMCNPGPRAARPGTEVERDRGMVRIRRLTIVLILGLLAPGSVAEAASGGAGVAAPQSPKGFDTSAVVYSSFARTLRKGERGQDVKTLQTWLSELGYNVPETGYFGLATQAQVKRFQLANQLAPASGAVGTRTASTLIAAVEETDEWLGRARRLGRERFVRMGVSAQADPPGARHQGVDA